MSEIYPETIKERVRRCIPFFDTLMNLADKLKAEAYIVGGTARGIIWGGNITDVDIVVFNCDYKKFASALSRELNTFSVNFKDNVALMSKDGCHIADVSNPRGKDIQTDLALRDFTINNLAIDKNYTLIGDMADLKASIVRVTNDNAFVDDPLRIVRAYRFMSTLGFKIEPHTKELIKRDFKLLPTSAYERVSNELNKLISNQGATYHVLNTLDMMYEDKILETIFDHNKFDLNSLKKPSCMNHTNYPFYLATIVEDDDNCEVVKKLKLSNKDIKFISLLRLIKRNIKNILTDEKKIKLFCYKHHDIFKIALNYLDIKSAITVPESERLTEYYKKIKLDKADAVNGDMLKQFADIRREDYKNVLDNIKIQLVFGELDIRDVTKYLMNGGR